LVKETLEEPVLQEAVQVLEVVAVLEPVAMMEQLIVLLLDQQEPVMGVLE
jgi:hypothetical protein